MRDRCGNGGDAAFRRATTIYVERYCELFGRERLVRAMVNTLNGEQKPEHVGFGPALQAVWAEYATEFGLDASMEWTDHLYDTDGDYSLHVDRAARLLVWLGVVAPTDGDAREMRRMREAAAKGAPSLHPLTEARANARATGASAGATSADDDDLLATMVDDLARELGLGDAHGGNISVAGLACAALGMMHAETLEATLRNCHAVVFGVVQPPQPQPHSQQQAAAATDVDAVDDDDEGVCAICCERKDDIEPLPHWGGDGAVGDVSRNAMCGACRAAWGRQTCPFCRDVLKADEVLGFIHAFVASVKGGARDPNRQAALLEQLQLFEMEHEAQPQVVARVFTLIAQDGDFGRALEVGLATGHDWLRDMAGVMLRLHGLAAEGELRGLESRHAKRLASAVDAIFAPFEREGADSPALDGHYIGALYMQAVVPWLCAWRGGGKTDVLASCVRRAGHAVVKWLDAQSGGGHRGGARRAELRLRIRERLHQEYAQLACTPVWGGQDDDPVWKAMFA